MLPLVRKQALSVVFEEGQAAVEARVIGRPRYGEWGEEPIYINAYRNYDHRHCFETSNFLNMYGAEEIWVMHSTIMEKYRGRGFGTRIYETIGRHLWEERRGIIVSGSYESTTSEMAQRVWEKLTSTHQGGVRKRSGWSYWWAIVR